MLPKCCHMLHKSCCHMLPHVASRDTHGRLFWCRGVAHWNTDTSCSPFSRGSPPCMSPQSLQIRTLSTSLPKILAKTHFMSAFYLHSFICAVLSAQFYLHSFICAVLSAQFYLRSFICTVLSAQFYLHSYRILNNSMLIVRGDLPTHVSDRPSGYTEPVRWRTGTSCSRRTTKSSRRTRTDAGGGVWRALGLRRKKVFQFGGGGGVEGTSMN